MPTLGLLRPPGQAGEKEEEAKTRRDQGQGKQSGQKTGSKRACLFLVAYSGERCLETQFPSIDGTWSQESGSNMVPNVIFWNMTQGDAWGWPQDIPVSCYFISSQSSHWTIRSAHCSVLDLMDRSWCPVPASAGSCLLPLPRRCLYPANASWQVWQGDYRKMQEYFIDASLHLGCHTSSNSSKILNRWEFIN